MMQELINKQRAYYAQGESRNLDFRLEKLKQLKKAVEKYEKKIEEALWEDLHKSAYESYLTEISLVKQELNDHIRHLRKWAKPRKVSSPVYLLGSKSRIIYEPLGVVLIIAPWNYPFQLLMTPLIGAISAGNCVVLKPSPYVPHVSEVIAELIAEWFAPDHVTVVQGGKEVNQALLALRFDYLFFTGSQALGKVVMKAAAEHLTPMTLELGGKSPCIVGQEANLKLAARRLIWGKCLNAGQTCIAPDYLFVHADVKDHLFIWMKYYIRQFYGEHPEGSPDYPRIVRKEAMERIVGLMGKGKIVCGGEVNRKERYIAPTIIDEVLPDDPVMQEEIFGPILPVMEYRCEEEIIHYINSREKPLALYYFGNLQEARYIISQTSSGGVCVNDTIMHIANLHLPFGGVGNSGMGKYHGKETFLTFSNRRSVLYSTTWWDIPLKYPPYKALSWLKRMPGFRA